MLSLLSLSARLETMADVETAPLLSGPGAAAPLAPAPLTQTQRNTKIAFNVAAVIAVLNLLGGNFLGTLVYEAAAIFLAYTIFDKRIMARGGEAFPRDTGLAYIACGIGPATLLIFAASVVANIAFFIPLAAAVFMSSPDWLQTVISGAKDISNHGGFHVKDDSFAEMRRQAFSHGRKLFSRTSMAHVTRAAVSATKAAGSAWDDLPESGSDDSFVVPPITFEDDGSNAAPVVASILRALSTISPLLLVAVLLVNSYVLKALIDIFVKFWLLKTRAMEREGATLRTVTASGLAIALGFSVSTMVLFGSGGSGGIFGALFSVLFFLLFTVYEMALTALVAIQLVQNESSSTAEQKNPLLIPVLLSGTAAFLPGLVFIACVKTALPVIADVLETGKGDAGQVLHGVSWLPYGFLVSISEVFIFIYTIRLARKRFAEATEQTLP